MDLVRAMLFAFGNAWLPLMGVPGRLWNRMEPERSMMIITSRGRWTAVAWAVVLKVFSPKRRPKEKFPVPVTVAWTALYGSAVSCRGIWMPKPSLLGSASLYV